MELSRRDFVKGLGLTTGLVLLSQPSGLGRLDKRVNALLASMEPKPHPLTEEAAMACLLWGGYWVAVSDRHMYELESNSIRRMVDSKIVRQAEAEILNSPDPVVYIKEQFQRAARRCLNMPLRARHGLAYSLITIAKADKQVEEEEEQVLREICSALSIAPIFVDKTLSMIGR